MVKSTFAAEVVVPVWAGLDALGLGEDGVELPDADGAGPITGPEPDVELLPDGAAVEPQPAIRAPQATRTAPPARSRTLARSGRCGDVMTI
jgi:hypothetical protein